MGSARYTAHVWINGQEVIRRKIRNDHIITNCVCQVMQHSGGHLPFEADVTDLLNGGDGAAANLVTVAVNNTLDQNTIPQGKWVWYEASAMSIIVYCVRYI